jgi:Tol biopolymer transport system component/ribosomal protein L24E
MRRFTRRPRTLLAALAAVVALAPGLSLSAPAQAATGTSRGYWFVAGDGGIFSFGDAKFQGSTGNLRLNQPIVGMATTPTGQGYWFVAADGGIFSFGDAKFHGSTGAMKLNRPIVGMAPTPTGKGYWFVASDGGIFSFGDAKFFGSTGAMKLNKPIVGMAASPTGNGYWFVASDGGIFSFGDAKFFGSTGTATNRSPIVGMASTPTGKGYWFASQDGSIHAFGDAGFFGSMGGRPLTTPIVGLSVTQTGRGYWLVGTDGGIFSFGDAGFFGSTGAMRLNRPIVGLAAAPPRGDDPGPGGTATTQPGTPTTGDPGGTTTTTVPGTPPTTMPPGSVNWGAAGATAIIERGNAGGGSAFRPWMSDNGRFVAFDSDGKNVVPGLLDTNNLRDVFVYDRETNTYFRVSVPTGGGEASGVSTGDAGGGGDGRPSTRPVNSERPTISADGCRIAFWSGATNLVPDDTNNVTDAFVHDRCVAGGQTVRVSVNTNGTQANDFSARPVISRNGRWVTFESAATNLISAGGIGGLIGGGGNDTNGVRDVFVHDLGNSSGQMSSDGVTSRVSITNTEAPNNQANGDSSKPSISADGTKIVYHSDAANLGGSGGTNIFLRDIHTSTTRLVSANADGTPADKSSASPSISADGRFVAFATRATNLSGRDNDGKFDVYVKDITNLPGGAVSLVSVASDGTPASYPAVAQGSVDPTISGDGSVVGFWSDAANLVPGDTNVGPGTNDDHGWDVFVHDRGTGLTRRVSVNGATQADKDAFSPALSTDGRFVAFDTKATTLSTPAEAPTSRSQDIFVHVL